MNPNNFIQMNIRDANFFGGTVKNIRAYNLMQDIYLPSEKSKCCKSFVYHQKLIGKTIHEIKKNAVKETFLKKNATKEELIDEIDRVIILKKFLPSGLDKDFSPEK